MEISENGTLDETHNVEFEGKGERGFVDDAEWNSVKELPFESANHKEMEKSSNGTLEDSHKVESEEMDERGFVDDAELQSEVESVKEYPVEYANHKEIEKSPNGTLEDTHKVESEEINERVFVDDAELKSEIEIPVEEDSEPVNGGQDADISSSDRSSSSSEEDEEVAADAVEPVASLSDDLDRVMVDPVEDLGASFVTEMEKKIIELESKEMVENSLPSSDEINGVSTVVTDEVSNDIVDVSALVTDVEETVMPLSCENNGIPRDLTYVSKGIEETEMPISDENIGKSSVDELSTETVIGSLQPSPNIPPAVNIVEVHQRNVPETHGNIGNSPILSVSRRTMQPTSWRSCCGLFNVLRRSDR